MATPDRQTRAADESPPPTVEDTIRPFVTPSYAPRWPQAPQLPRAKGSKKGRPSASSSVGTLLENVAKGNKGQLLWPEAGNPGVFDALRPNEDEVDDDLVVMGILPPKCDRAPAATAQQPFSKATPKQPSRRAPPKETPTQARSYSGAPLDRSQRAALPSATPTTVHDNGKAVSTAGSTHEHFHTTRQTRTLRNRETQNSRTLDDQEVLAPAHGSRSPAGLAGKSTDTRKHSPKRTRQEAEDRFTAEGEEVTEPTPSNKPSVSEEASNIVVLKYRHGDQPAGSTQHAEDEGDNAVPRSKKRKASLTALPEDSNRNAGNGESSSVQTGPKRIRLTLKMPANPAHDETAADAAAADQDADDQDSAPVNDRSPDDDDDDHHDVEEDDSATDDATAIIGDDGFLLLTPFPIFRLGVDMSAYLTLRYTTASLPSPHEWHYKNHRGDNITDVDWADAAQIKRLNSWADRFVRRHGAFPPPSSRGTTYHPQEREYLRTLAREAKEEGRVGERGLKRVLFERYNAYWAGRRIGNSVRPRRTEGSLDSEVYKHGLFDALKK